MADGGDPPAADTLLNTPGSISYDEFKRGLHLLAPEFRVFEEKLNALTAQMQEVKTALASKETVANVDQVKVEIASMMPTLKQKADEAELKRLNTHLQQLSASMGAKAETSVVEHLSQQYASLSSTSVSKGELAALSARLEQVSAKIDANINNMQSTLDTFDIADMSKRLDSLTNSTITPQQLKENLGPLKNMLDTLNTTLLQKASISDLTSLRSAVDGIQDAVKGKAEASIVEQLNTQYRQINKALTQKAEFTEVEELRSQIKVIAKDVELKAGHPEVDALSLQLKGLTGGLASTIDEKVEQKVVSRYKFDTDKLTEFVNKSIAELKNSLSDVEKTVKTKSTIADLEKISKQVAALVDSILQKEVKIEDLGKQLADCKKSIGLKAEDSRVDRVAKDLENLITSVTKNSSELKALSTNLEDCKKTVAKKAEDIKVDKLATLIEGLADKKVVDRLVKQMDSVADTLARKSVDVDELQKRVQETLSSRIFRFDDLDKRLTDMHDLQAILAKIDKLENLSGQVDLLFNKLASKADNAVMDELLNNLRGKAENTTVDQLSARVNNGMDSMARRVRMLIDALINTIRRNAMELGSPSAVRIGGGYLTSSSPDAPPDAELIDVLQQITAEDFNATATPRVTTDTFGADSPLSSPRIATRPATGTSANLSQVRKELDDFYTALSRKADKSALSTLASEVQRLSDFTMTQVLQMPSSLPPGTVRPQSGLRGATASRPTTPRGARRPHFGP
eukprot:gnl/MRDRNA2_/MRDRNA2_50399_c0_seq1.p1 gnl/MRDRNA2_/MRDRNA2_50399_c0~~gnl/MRDRNA2_/MRDRNA2_50399_c0_seq1.p1  ORF type:complete len:742 (+),score=179.12 gnl/MRDRNA2_/MRDRNA2_50399_c0_seq1:79-2304(+)